MKYLTECMTEVLIDKVATGQGIIYLVREILFLSGKVSEGILKTEVSMFVATMLEFVLSGCHKRCKSSWMYKYMWCSFIAIFVARKSNMYVKPCRVEGNNF